MNQNQEILSNIDDIEVYKRRHELMLEMFNTRGWKLLMQEYQEDMESCEQSLLKTADMSDSSNNIWYWRGMLQFFDIILNYEKTEHETYKQVIHEISESKEDTIKYPTGL